MRKVTRNVQSFDSIEQPVKRSAPISKQPILKYQKTTQQQKKQLYYGLKDLSVDYQTKYSQNQQTIFKKLLPIINPESKLLLLWNILTELAVLFNFFMGPLVATYTYQAYQFDMKTKTGISLNAISLLILYIDIFVRFHVCYYKREKLISDRMAIFKRYIRFQFWIDLISVICLTIYMAADSYQMCYVRLAVYLRFPTLIDIDQSILQNLSLPKSFILFYRLIRMVVIIWLLTTWAACVFFAIDYSYYQDPNNTYTQLGQLWLTGSQAVNDSDIITTFPQWQIWYLYSLYWSIQTSCTTGYGDLTPRNPPQIIYCNVIMLLMTVLFAYFINEVWSIIQQVQSEWQSNKNWHQLKLYLKQIDLPGSQKQKISSYMKEVFQDQEQMQIQDFITKNISQEVKDSFYYQVRKEFFEFSIFNFINYSLNQKEIKTSLVYVIEELRQGQDQFIYSIGELDLTLYFLRSGSIQLQQKVSSLGMELKRNQMFGLFQFITHRPRSHNAVSRTFVRLWKLEYQKFKKCIKSNKQSYINFLLMHEELNLYKNLQLIRQKKCWKCHQNHFIHQCSDICQQRVQNRIRYISSMNRGLSVSKRRDYKRVQLRQKKLLCKLKQDRNISIDTVCNMSNYYPSYNIMVS